MALEEQECDEHGQRAEDAGGKRQAVLRAVGALKERDADRQGELIDRIEENQWAEELVPRGDKGEDGERGEGGLRERQHDSEEHAEPRAAVQPGRLLQVPRNAEEELMEQEEAERA